MTRYVLGFCFDENMDKVALIQKQKPAWQKGLFNGIGGKIEPDESDINAMHREFFEETGVDPVGAWIHFTTMTGKDWEVECFYLWANKEDFKKIETKEVEEVFKIPVNHLLKTNTISNLQWLIPLAIDHRNIDYEIVHII